MEVGLSRKRHDEEKALVKSECITPIRRSWYQNRWEWGRQQKIPMYKQQSMARSDEIVSNAKDTTKQGKQAKDTEVLQLS